MLRFVSKRILDSMKRSLVTEVAGPNYKIASLKPANNFCTMNSDCKPFVGPIRNPMVWIDMEMTGLDPIEDKVMEIAVLITDGELNIVAEGPNLVVHQDDATLENMNNWCITQHGKTGLTQQCRESKLTVHDAEDQVLLFLRKHLNQGQVPLAGNSVYVDRKFIARYMPRVDKFLHYRIVDVSSIKELCKIWYPSEYENSPPKGGSHRALDDIKESVKELQYYRQAVFKSKPNTSE